MHEAAAAFVRMEMEGVEGGGEDGGGGGFAAEEEEVATVERAAAEEGALQLTPTLSLPHDVSHYRGQNLVQGLAASNAAAALTGIPLISFAGSHAVAGGSLGGAKFHHQHQQAYQGSFTCNYLRNLSSDLPSTLMGEGVRLYPYM